MSDPILERFDTGFARAMSAAEHLSSGFEPMPNNAAFAMGTFWRKHLNGTLEGVEIM
jgi:hypothetical protein